MKGITRLLILALVLLVSCWPHTAKADNRTDNHLEIDEDRLGTEENETIGDVSDLVVSLFQSENQEQFKVYRKQQRQEETDLVQNLFMQEQAKQSSAKTKTLFINQPEGVYNTYQSQETDSQFGLSVDGFWLMVGYGALLLVVLTVAGTASYRINKEVEDGFTH